MPIALECTCGKKLRVKDELAGKKIRCPECKGVIAVPAPEVEPDEEEAGAYLAEDPPKAKSTSKAKSKSSEDDDGDRDSYLTAETPKPKSTSKSKSKSGDDDEDDDGEKKSPWDEPERKRKEPKREKPRRERRERERYSSSRSSGSSGSGFPVNGGSIAAGLLMMVGAVVWFVVGLAAGWIYFYPPILFVLGIVAVVKGLRGQAD